LGGSAERNFILQQGVQAPPPRECARLASALLFQARIIGGIALLGVATQARVLFAALALVLAWSALLPRLNPFDFAYNHTLGRRPGAPKLGPAPPPRRFAQGMAATFAIAVVASLSADLRVTAWVLEGFFLLAIAALVLGRFCLGSFVYHLIRGRRAFAVNTLPWGRGGGA